MLKKNTYQALNGPDESNVTPVTPVLPFTSDITYPDSKVMSIGMDCLKIPKDGSALKLESLKRNTVQAIKRYPESHIAPIALASILAFITVNQDKNEIRSHVVNIIKALDEHGLF